MNRQSAGYATMFCLIVVICLTIIYTGLEYRLIRQGTINKVDSLEYIIRELHSTTQRQQYLVEYYSNRWEVSMKVIESYRRNP